MIRRLQVNDPRFARLRVAVRTDSRARATAFVLLAGVLRECREIQHRAVAGQVNPVRDIRDVTGQPAEAE